MTTPRPCMCYMRGCLHFWGTAGPPEDPVYQCAAFPTGIPVEIERGEDLHMAPRETQDGELKYSPGGNRPAWARLIRGKWQKRKAPVTVVTGAEGYQEGG